MYSDVESLSVPLPEDIEKVKWYGDFAQAAKMIDLRLKTDIPEALKKRLRYERRSCPAFRLSILIAGRMP